MSHSTQAPGPSLEQQLLQALQIEAIGRLAAGIAHDFNDLLTVILGISESRVEGLGKDDPARANLQEIIQAAQRAALLTRQLLAFSGDDGAPPALSSSPPAAPPLSSSLIAPEAPQPGSVVDRR